MCCLLFVLALLGPRAMLAFWWLVDQAWFNRVYDTFFVPFLGFLFVPWTTLIYTLVASPSAGITGWWNWLWVGLGLLADIGTYTGGGYGNRNRIPGYPGTTTTSGL